MIENQLCYYLQMAEYYFQNPKVVLLEKYENGCLLSLILIKLYLQALKFNGVIKITKDKPYTMYMLSSIFGISEIELKKAFDIYEKYQFIEVLSNGSIIMLDIIELVGNGSEKNDIKEKLKACIKIEYELSELNEKKLNISSPKTEEALELKEDLNIDLEQHTEIKDDKFNENLNNYHNEIDNRFKMLIKYEFVSVLSEKELKVIIKHCIDKGYTDKYLLEKIEILKNSKYVKSNIGFLISALNEDYKLNNDINPFKFNNFEARKYDYEQLEKDLLGWYRKNEEVE